MKIKDRLCVCGYWLSKHEAYDQPENHYVCSAGKCDCNWFSHDARTERDMYNEELERSYNLSREK